MIGCKVIHDKRPPHIWLNIFAFPHIFGSPSSDMTLQPPSRLNFLIYEENFVSFFISVTLLSLSDSDPDPLVRGMDPDPDSSVIKQKK